MTWQGPRYPDSTCLLYCLLWKTVHQKNVLSVLYVFLRFSQSCDWCSGWCLFQMWWCAICSQWSHSPHWHSVLPFFLYCLRCQDSLHIVAPHKDKWNILIMSLPGIPVYAHIFAFLLTTHPTGGLAHRAICATLHPFEDAMSVVAIISFLKMLSFVFFYFV